MEVKLLAGKLGTSNNEVKHGKTIGKPALIGVTYWVQQVLLLGWFVEVARFTCTIFDGMNIQLQFQGVLTCKHV